MSIIYPILSFFVQFDTKKRGKISILKLNHHHLSMSLLRSFTKKSNPQLIYHHSGPRYKKNDKEEKNKKVKKMEKLTKK